MKDRETARMRKYGESKTTRIMMATVPDVTSGLGLPKFQADGFLLTRVYILNIGSSPLPTVQVLISLMPVRISSSSQIATCHFSLRTQLCEKQ